MLRSIALRSSALVMMLGCIVGGFLLAPRDGSVTLGIKSFDPHDIVQERLWEEHPVQVINTFFIEGTRFLGLGGQDTTSVELVKRLELKYGSDFIDKSSGYVDLEEVIVGSDDRYMEVFRGFLDGGGYYHRMGCPHDTGLLCRVGVAWNREFTRAKGVTLIFFRTAENEYTFVDSSLFTFGG